LDGKELLLLFRQTIGEPAGAGILDDKTTYSFINRGAIEVVRKTNSIHTTQSISTTADTTNYDLNANYLQLYLKNRQNEFYIKYNDGSTDYFLNFKPYTDIIYSNQTTSVTIPSEFSIIDKSALYSRISSTTTSAGASAAGEATLTDTASNFITGGVSAGDIVNNTTDGSTGYVLRVSSSTALVCALFDGTGNDFTSGDAYVIQPQPRKQLVLNPPPSSANHTITFYYTSKPEPVYADYGMFRFTDHYNWATIYYAAGFYKMRDRDDKMAKNFFAIADQELREDKAASDMEFHKGHTMRVNLRPKI
jgi:hypothetical protein